MCFFKKPKLKKPKTEAAPIPQTPPIAEATPKVVSGAEEANVERRKKRATSDQPSLFQIALLPGTAGSFEEPGANLNG